MADDIEPNSETVRSVEEFLQSLKKPAPEEKVDIRLIPRLQEVGGPDKFSAAKQAMKQLEDQMREKDMSSEKALKLGLFWLVFKAEYEFYVSEVQKDKEDMISRGLFDLYTYLKSRDEGILVASQQGDHRPLKDFLIKFGQAVVEQAEKNKEPLATQTPPLPRNLHGIDRGTAEYPRYESYEEVYFRGTHTAKIFGQNLTVIGEKIPVISSIPPLPGPAWKSLEDLKI